MLGYERYKGLHTIVMLKDVIRRWWRVELAFTDKSGYVLDHAKGEIIPPQNDICRLSLFSKEGFKRCNASIRVINDRFKQNPKLRTIATHECHMGFSIVGAPVHLGGEFEGSIFCCGVAREKPSPAQAARIAERTLQLNPQASDVERGIERIPVMTTAEVERLGDLMQFAANEVAAYDTTSAKREAAARDAHEIAPNRFATIVGKSEPMVAIFRLLEKLADSDSGVLLQGEAGTGKELLARAIHESGPRRDRPFLVHTCSGMADQLLESALFGHTKGAFLGALRDRRGLFSAADGGTLVLDEIGDLSPALQVKVLRAIQEGVFMPLGTATPQSADVRVIATSRHDVADLVARGLFREDLFYRINVIRVIVPPLRERKDDLPLLVEHFLDKHARGGVPRTLAPETMALLGAYAWPGNIRELENELERMLVLAPGDGAIGPSAVSPRLREAAGLVEENSAPRALHGRLKHAVEALERDMIYQGLVRTHWNKSKLARELGVSRSNLILKIEKYKLEDGGEGSRLP